MWRKAKYIDIVLPAIAEELVVDVQYVTIQYEQMGFPWTASLGNGVVYIGKPATANFTIRSILW